MTKIFDEYEEKIATALIYLRTKGIRESILK